MAKRAAKAKEEIEILEKLRFISLAQSETGAPNQTHCHFNGNTLIAYDGIIAAGIMLTDNMPDCCPNTYQLIHALERASDVSAMTFENNSITIKTNKFKAIVNCIPTTDLFPVFPDTGQYPLGDDFRRAANLASIYTKEGAQTVVAASVMLRNGSIVGTNGVAIIEVAHGFAMPPGLIVPMTFVTALDKIKKPIQSFGFSDTSLTIHFQDNSFLKTQLYSEPWPNIDLFLAYTETAHYIDVPKEFFPAIKSVAPFSDDTRVYFNENLIKSNRNEGVGAEYIVKGVPADHSYNIKNLMVLSDIITKIDFTGNERVTCFMGDKLRGVLAKSK